MNSFFGFLTEGRSISAPSKLHSQSSGSCLCFTVWETRILYCWSIVISPWSNARSWNAFKSKPLSVARRSVFGLQIFQGLMWLATNSLGIEMPVMQHLLWYALRRELRKYRWLTRCLTAAIRSCPSGIDSRLRSMGRKESSFLSGPAVAWSRRSSDSLTSSSPLLSCSIQISLSSLLPCDMPTRPDSTRLASLAAMFQSLRATAEGVLSRALASAMISELRLSMWEGSRSK